MVKIINIHLFFCLFFLTGCTQNNASHQLDFEQKEFILTKVNNNKGLIDLYREKLRENDDDKTRYKLADRYYITEDYDASFRYLKPLLEKSEDDQVLILACKDNLETGNTDLALNYINRVIKNNDRNGEAYNLKGVLLAQKRDFKGAYASYDEARQRFVDEQVVGNNIAMTNIMQGDYASAKDNLLNLYRSGNSNQQIKHNLAYAFIKLHDVASAEAILHEISPSETTDDIIRSLANVNPVSSRQPTVKSASYSNHFDSGNIGIFDKPISRSGFDSLSASSTGIPLKNSYLPAAKSRIRDDVQNLSSNDSLNFKRISLKNIKSSDSTLSFSLTSRYALNYRVIPISNKNTIEIQLLNCQLDKKLEGKVNDILNVNGISHTSVRQESEGNVIIDIVFKDHITDSSIQRSGGSSQSLHSLDIAIVHHN